MDNSKDNDLTSLLGVELKEIDDPFIKGPVDLIKIKLSGINNEIEAAKNRIRSKQLEIERIKEESSALRYTKRILENLLSDIAGKFIFVKRPK